MQAELIAVGTELLLGHTIDTGSAYASRELAASGIDVLRRFTVGDNPARLEETLRLALSRSDLVVLIGGLGLCVLFRPWHVVGQWDAVTVLGMAYIIVFGTICAFCCYLEGVRRIGAARGSILSSIEPVASTVLSVFWLGVPLGGMDFGGIALIVAAMVLLAGDDGGKPPEKPRKIREKIREEAKKD